MRNMVIALWGMSRPIILSGMLIVPVVGMSMAFAQGYTPTLSTLVWGMTALGLACASVNYMNEYADWETDALTERTRYSGGSGVLPAGLAPRRLAFQAGVVSYVLGVGLGLAGLAAGVVSGAALVVLALGGLAGWMYSLPPLKLAWNGGAELVNGILGGLALPVFGYALVTGGLEWPVVLAMIPYALMIFTTAMATTWPDRGADRQVGKRTLATWMSAGGLRVVYGLVTAVAFGLLPALALSGIPVQVIIASLVALPAAVIGAARYTRIRNPHPSARAAMMLVFAQTTAWLWIGLNLTPV